MHFHIGNWIEYWKDKKIKITLACFLIFFFPWNLPLLQKKWKNNFKPERQCSAGTHVHKRGVDFGESPLWFPGLEDIWQVQIRVTPHSPNLWIPKLSQCLRKPISDYCMGEKPKLWTWQVKAIQFISKSLQIQDFPWSHHSLWTCPLLFVKERKETHFG